MGMATLWHPYGYPMASLWVEREKSGISAKDERSLFLKSCHFPGIVDIAKKYSYILFWLIIPVVRKTQNICLILISPIWTENFAPLKGKIFSLEGAQIFSLRSEIKLMYRLYGKHIAWCWKATGNFFTIWRACNWGQPPFCTILHILHINVLCYLLNR